MQTETEADPADQVKEFVKTLAGAGEFDKLNPVDYHPADKDTFVCVMWDPSDEGREQMTHLQMRVDGVDKRFQGISVDNTNLARGYAKFSAEY